MPQQTANQPSDNKAHGMALKAVLILTLLLMFGGVLAALLKLDFGGLMFASGLGLLCLSVGVQGLLRDIRKNPLVNLLFILFGGFLFWIVLNPYIYQLP
jgi:hypothetical protein